MGGHSANWTRLGKGDLPCEDMAVGLGHIGSTRTYFHVYLALLVLTAITVFIATFDLGSLNVAVALLVASIKAGVVTLLFMHLKYESKIFWGIVIAPPIILLLLFLGTLGDWMAKEDVQPMFVSAAPPAAEQAAIPPKAH